MLVSLALAASCLGSEGNHDGIVFDSLRACGLVAENAAYFVGIPSVRLASKNEAQSGSSDDRCLSNG